MSSGADRPSPHPQAGGRRTRVPPKKSAADLLWALPFLTCGHSAKNPSSRLVKGFRETPHLRTQRPPPRGALISEAPTSQKSAEEARGWSLCAIAGWIPARRRDQAVERAVERAKGVIEHADDALDQRVRWFERP